MYHVRRHDWITIACATLWLTVMIDFIYCNIYHNNNNCVSVSGTLHVGDEIREINSVSVHQQTVETLQKMLVRLLVGNDIDLFLNSLE